MEMRSYRPFPLVGPRQRPAEPQQHQMGAKRTWDSVRTQHDRNPVDYDRHQASLPAYSVETLLYGSTGLMSPPSLPLTGNDRRTNRRKSHASHRRAGPSL